MAGFSLGDILVNIKANTDGLKKGLGDVQQMGEQTKSMGEKISGGMKVAAASMAVAGAGLALYAKSATSFTVDLVKSSTMLGREIGVTTIEASRLVAALGRMGIDADKASTVFGIFSKKINEARTSSESSRIAHQALALQIRQTQMEIEKTTAEIAKNGDKTGELGLKVETLKNKMTGLQDQLNQSANAFDKLGVSVKNADGTNKAFTQILGEVADKFKAMPNGIEKTALSMELFGRSGKDMIKVLNLGADGIAALEKEADKLGLTLNADTIVKVQKLVQSQKELKQSTDALKIAVGTATAPVLTEFNKKINDVVMGLLNAKGPIHDVTVGILAFGGPTLAAAAAVTTFGANMVTMWPVLAKVATALRATAAAQWVLNIAMAANPIGLLIVAIAALGTAIFLALTHMQELGTFMVTITDWLTQSWHPAILAAIAVFMPFIGLPLLLVAYWTPISGFFANLWATVSGFFAAHWQLIVGIVFGAVGLITGFIIGHFNSIVGFLWGVVGSIAGAMNAIASWFRSLPGAAAGAVGSVVSFFASLPGRILGAVGNLGNLLYSAGAAVISGFLRGLASNIGQVYSFVKGIASWIAKNKGPIDKDKRLLIPAGKAIIQGFQVGLEAQWKSVQSFIKGLGVEIGGNMLSPALAGGSASPGSSSVSSSTNIYGNINIGSKGDADYLMVRLDRNSSIVERGGSPI